MPSIYIKDYDTTVEIPEGSDMNQVQDALKKQFPPKKKETTPEWAGKYPNLYGVAGAARETLGPIAEALSLAGGAIAGGGPASPGTAALGAGLAYSGTRRALSAADVALGNAPDQSIGREALSGAEDVATGMTTELGGQVLSKGVSSAVESAKKYAPRLYESALKPSTTLTQSARERRVGTALKESIPVSEKGLEKSKSMIGELNNRISNRIQGATGVTISREGALSKVSELPGKIREAKIDPSADLEHVAKYIEGIQAEQPERIAVQSAQKYKQTLNKELNDYYAAFTKGKITPPQIYAKTKAAMADGLREEIANTFPELKQLNAKEGALIELNKTLERSVNRIKNREIVPLLVGLAASGKGSSSILKALALKAVEHPEVKSKLAIALYKASPKVAGEFSRGALVSSIAAGAKMPDVVSSAEAAGYGTYLDQQARRKAIEEATGEVTRQEAPAPKRAVETERTQTALPRNMTKEELSKYDAETRKLAEELSRRKAAEASSKAAPASTKKTYMVVYEGNTKKLMDEETGDIIPYDPKLDPERKGKR